ncbi:DNA-dependent RNA polymerase auxiliary subunit epsilon family protein [Carnobacteriaceae bacterium zg-C25]|nr:DNA-dependent RNA polymerase auxiliary subunit epsilon family protein [Carnobacteriaceae bacterium zg-ZUI240]QTU83068.1 DNA-dependent RNA polymerase auxiliary subunit epsilon family protein [Carnobacteriaceae bacterium zg-C25]
MIFKVTYQETKSQAPRRENTKTLYIEAPSRVEAREQIEKNTPYNIEFIQELEGKHLAYEQQSADFALTEF